MEYIPSILLWAVIIGAIVYHLFIKKGQNRKQAQTGEDKQRVKQAVEPLLREEGGFRLAYAHWEEQESHARTVKTTYYRYAAAFKDQTLWVIPLGIDKKTREVQAGRPIMLAAERLGKVEVKTKEKDGAVSRVEVWLGDKQGRAIIQLKVDAESLRKTRWYPVNIIQQEECEAFGHFITALAQRVAKENPGIDAVMEANAGEGYGVMGAGLSIVGIIGGIFSPILGVILCTLGLILSVVGKLKGAKGKICLIISIICAVLIVVYCPIYWKYIFV